MTKKYFRVELNPFDTGRIYETSVMNYGDNFKDNHYDHFLKTYFSVLDQVNLPVDFLVSATNQIMAMGDMYTDVLMDAIDNENNIVLYKVTRNEKHKNYKIPVSIMGEFLQSFDEHNQFIYFDNGTVLWEAFFEKVRAKEFPHLPSRMNSTFLFSDIQSCTFYQKNHCGGQGTVVEIETVRTDKIFEGDMKIIDDIENSISRDELTEKIRQYWKGEQTTNCVKEYIFQGEYNINDLV